jgi:hypothetical protein
MAGEHPTTNDGYTGNAAEYLDTGYEAFCDALDPDFLYVGADRITPDHPLVNSSACWRAVRRVRVCVVFAAFACEAAANEFLAARLAADGPLFKMLDDRKTSEKLLTGAEIVLGERLFDPGAEPYQTLASLFKARDRLAHARPETFHAGATSSYSGPAELAKLGPAQASRFLVSTAQVMVELGKHFRPVAYVAADLLLENRTCVMKIGRDFENQVPSLTGRRPPSLAHLGR